MPNTTSDRNRDAARYGDPGVRRLALAPAILAILALVIGFALVESGGFVVIRYVVSILALICLVFAFQARQWWWIPLLLAVAVLWNPAFVIPVPQPGWIGAQYLAIAVFGLVGLLVKVRTPPADRAGRR